MKKVSEEALEELRVILDCSVKEAVDNIENIVKGDKDTASTVLFSIQNALAIGEYVKIVKEKLGLRKDR